MEKGFIFLFFSSKTFAHGMPVFDPSDRRGKAVSYTFDREAHG